MQWPDEKKKRLSFWSLWEGREISGSYWWRSSWMATSCSDIRMPFLSQLSLVPRTALLRPIWALAMIFYWHFVLSHAIYSCSFIFSFGCSQPLHWSALFRLCVVVVFVIVPVLAFTFLACIYFYLFLFMPERINNQSINQSTVSCACIHVPGLYLFTFFIFPFTFLSGHINIHTYINP